MDPFSAIFKTKRFLPIISIFLVCPIWTNEGQISFIHKNQKEFNLEEISFDDPFVSIDSNYGNGIVKSSKIKEKLIEIKKRLIEKEKQLVIMQQELAEREKRLAIRKKQLFINEQKLQRLLEAQEEQTLQLEAYTEVQVALPEEEQPLIVQEQQQYTKGLVQPAKTTDNAPPPWPKNQHEKKCRSPYRIMHVGLRHTEGRGVGYSDGYTTLEAFGIYDRNTSWMPFLDLRGHVFDNGKLAGNAGVGMRSYFPSVGHVFGAYLYYDVRQDTHLTAQQLSPGIELLGSRMEYRINSYFPIADKKTHKYDFEFSKFEGNHIILKSKQKRVLCGGDAEIGAHLTQSTKYDVYAGAGPYYFTTFHASAWGGKARLLGRYQQYISLEASYSYDHLFKNVVQGTIAFNMPFGNKIRRKAKSCSQQTDLALGRAAFAPYRFEIPVIKDVRRKETAINPYTGSPWQVWFVDNTSSSSGTFESPFPTLVQAQNVSSEGDIIYVFPGDGTTTGMNAGIILQDFQKLWGSGISHQLKTTKGTIKVPAFSNSYPSITNFTADVVALANENEISGFNILVTASGFSGIAGGIGTVGATITDNFISGSVDHYGIFINQGHGKYVIKNNQMLVSGASTLRGIRIITDNNSFTEGIISNNIIDGYHFSLSFTPAMNTYLTNGKFTIEQNTISSFQTGFITAQGFVNGEYNFINNTFYNNNNVGTNSIFFNMANGVPNINLGKVTIQGNNFITTSTAAQNAITVAGNAASGCFFTADVVGNTIQTAGGIGININDASGNTICASITNNQITQPTPATTNNIRIAAGGTGVINIDNFSGNTGNNTSITGNVNRVPAGTCD